MRRDTMQRKTPTTAVQWLRIVVLVALGIAIVWVSIAVTMGQILARSDSAGSRPRWFAADANGWAATVLLAKTGPDGGTDLPLVRQLATTSIRHKPLSIGALRALGLQEAILGHADNARRLFTYAESMSRRDVQTQLWLLEERVNAGDIPGALKHYDLAMRTSVPIRQMLLPVLAGSANDPLIAQMLARTLSARPNWWPEGLQAISAVTTNPASYARIIGQIHLDAARPDEANILSEAMTKLATMGRADLAYDLNPERKATQRTSIRNATFDRPEGLPPFSWDLTHTEDLSAVIEPRSGGRGNVLSVAGDANGMIARQLVMFPAGSYRLTGRAGRPAEASGGGLKVSLSCANDTQHSLASTVLLREGIHSFALDITVPPACPAQWLRIDSMGAEVAESAPWIDDLAMTVR